MRHMQCISSESKVLFCNNGGKPTNLNEQNIISELMTNLVEVVEDSFRLLYKSRFYVKISSSKQA